MFRSAFCLLAMLASVSACDRVTPNATTAVDENANVLALVPQPVGGEPSVAEPRATLVRFWTDTCPFCASSLPVLEALRLEFEPQGLAVRAVYHPKPPRAVEANDAVSAAQKLGFQGAVALDPEWAALRQIWLDHGDRRATSASFLFDAEGEVLHTHPGPEFFPSTDPADAEANQGYLELRSAIETALQVAAE